MHIWDILYQVIGVKQISYKHLSSLKESGDIFFTTENGTIVFESIEDDKGKFISVYTHIFFFTVILLSLFVCLNKIPV